MFAGMKDMVNSPLPKIDEEWQEMPATRYVADSVSADVQLQRDIEAARGVKPGTISLEEFAEKVVNPAYDKLYPGAHRDPVNHPPHYTSHPSGIEAIQVTEHMGFCLGNAVKYIWRADLKGNAIEDLRKAAFYIEREIKRRGG